MNNYDAQLFGIKDAGRKYNIPNYRFSRVLNMKYGRPSYREQVYELCKKYNKLD